MIQEESSIQKYIDEKKELHKLIFQIIEQSNDDDDDKDYNNLENYLSTQGYLGNKEELEHFLRLISTISTNHYRNSNFFNKIEKILTISSKFYRLLFSNKEIFTIFENSKPILLSLLKSKIIEIDAKIFSRLQCYKEINVDETYYYFYPELKQSMESIKFLQNNDIIEMKDDIEKFESNRQKFENDSQLCSIIREDLIDDFIQYVHQTNISLSTEIKRSLFETHPIFIEKEPTLIEYAAFYGSIKIMHYLEINKVELKSSLWLYAVHSNNPEIIQFFEEKKIEIDNRTFSEAIKCHHNDIANYIYDNYLNNPLNITDLDDESVLSIYSSNNYEFFSNEIDENKIFFSLCQNNYNKLVNLYLSLNNEEIEKYISQQNESEIEAVIKQALNKNKLDVAYYSLQKIKNIPQNYFERLHFEKIALPPNIRSIESDSFRLCSSLKHISISSSINIMEYDVFSKCSSLTQISIPSSVTMISNNAFCEYSSLTQISIPSSVTYIGDSAFKNCSSLRQVSIPYSVNHIGSNAFDNCSSLKQISIPSSVLQIGAFAFSNCSSLTQISIPSSLTHFGPALFYLCGKLKQIIITQSKEERLRFYENEFFIFKSNPNSDIFDTLLMVKPINNTINIPQFINKIEFMCFFGCTTITSITIPNSVKEIGLNAFYGCSSLAQITIPSSVLKIGNSAFRRCSSLTQITIPSSMTEIENALFYECSSLTQIIIPSSVTSIGRDAFKKCTSLTQITIPSSVKLIGNDAFERCTALREIILPDSIETEKLAIPSHVIIKRAKNNCTIY